MRSSWVWLTANTTLLQTSGITRRQVISENSTRSS